MHSCEIQNITERSLHLSRRFPSVFGINEENLQNMDHSNMNKSNRIPGKINFCYENDIETKNKELLMSSPMSPRKKKYSVSKKKSDKNSKSCLSEMSMAKGVS